MVMQDEADINRDMESDYINMRYSNLRNTIAGNYPKMVTYETLDKIASKLFEIREYSEAVKTYFIAAETGMRHADTPELLRYLPVSTNSIRAIMNEIVFDRGAPESVLSICREMKNEIIASIAADVFVSNGLYTEATRAYLTVDNYIQIMDVLKKAPLPDIKQSIGLLIDRGAVDSVNVFTRELRKGRIMEPGVAEFIKEVENLVAASRLQKTSLKDVEAQIIARKAEIEQEPPKPHNADEVLGKMAVRIDRNYREKTPISLDKEEITLACAILNSKKEVKLKETVVVAFVKILSPNAPPNDMKEEALTHLYNAFEQCNIIDRSKEALLGATLKKILELQDSMFGTAGAGAKASIQPKMILEIIAKVESHAKLEGLITKLIEKGDSLKMSVDEPLPIEEFDRRSNAIKLNNYEIEVLQRKLLESPISDAELKMVCEALRPDSGAPEQRKQIISALPAFRSAFIGNPDRFDLFVRNVYDSVIASKTLESDSADFAVTKAIFLSFRMFNSATCLSFEDLGNLQAKAAGMLRNASSADMRSLGETELVTITADFQRLKTVLGQVTELKAQALAPRTIAAVKEHMGRIVDIREILQETSRSGIKMAHDDAKTFHRPGAQGTGAATQPKKSTI